MMLIRYTTKLFTVSLVALGALFGLISAWLWIDWLLFANAQALVTAIVVSTITAGVFALRAVVNTLANGGE